MGSNTDYQNAMSVDTRAIDTAGEQAADEINAETAPVRDEKIVTSQSDKETHTQTRGTFGVLPHLEIPDDYAQTRMFYFKNLAIETGTKRNPLNPLEPGNTTAAFTSQQRMANAYLKDLSLITTAQRHYDMLVPLSTMAAKAFAKVHEIGQHTGLSDQRGPQLNGKEQRALNKASRNQKNPLNQEHSLNAASDAVLAARTGMETASMNLAAKVQTHVVARLIEEYERAVGDKAAIQAKIQRAQQIVGYLGTAASMIAGGAGFVHENISIGKPNVMAGTAAVEHDLRHSDVEAAKTRGEQGKKGAGAAAGVVAFGMKLYHEQELTKIEQTIDVVRGMLDKSKHDQELDQINAARTEFVQAQENYRRAIVNYEARVNDRRKDMANVGHEADQIVDKRGSNSNASDAMLWTASVMETQSFVSTAVHVGRSAEYSVADAYKTMLGHRRQRWGTLADVYGPSNTPRTEGEGGRDLVALRKLRTLVTQWLEGAEDIQKTMNEVADEQGKPVLEAAGYTGDY